MTILGNTTIKILAGEFILKQMFTEDNCVNIIEWFASDLISGKTYTYFNGNIFLEHENYRKNNFLEPQKFIGVSPKFL